MSGMGVMRVVCAAMLLALAACAGTVKQDLRVQGDVSRVEGVSQVVVQMSPDAQKQQSDNAQFNREELAAFLRRRLEAKGFVAASATHRVGIVVTDIRVRSAFAAVMFGVLAGDDHVTGRVRLLDPQGRALRSFEINANYALGGVGGGQDGTRMNWLYDKFTELASVELEKVIMPPKLAAAPAAPTAGASAQLVVAVPVSVPTLAVNAAARVEDVEAVPSLSERGREGYRDWLTHRAPRAFVLAEGGRWYGTWGTNPKEPMDPRDPTERALKHCRDAGRSQCAVYAVDDKVMVLPQALSAR